MLAHARTLCIPMGYYSLFLKRGMQSFLFFSHVEFPSIDEIRFYEIVSGCGLCSIFRNIVSKVLEVTAEGKCCDASVDFRKIIFGN